MTHLLPVSKSIAQRQLMCRAMSGEIFRSLPDTVATAVLPDDVLVLHDALRRICHNRKDCLAERKFRIDVGGNGTAMRFLTAYCAQLDGIEVVLDGSERMHERTIEQLVDALRLIGSEIEYLGNKGFPPLRIYGRTLDKSRTVTLNSPLSSQFVSALLLIGVEVHTDDKSPYIEMTRRVIGHESGQNTEYESLKSDYQDELFATERDWSAAAFWLEHEVVSDRQGTNGDKLSNSMEAILPPRDSLQGDRVAAELFTHIADGTLREWNFTQCPDLYPAAAVACYKKGLHPTFTGLERLRYKESDRVAAVEGNFRRIEHGEAPLSYNDHRIAMAFMAAGYKIADNNYECIAKSYPAFVSQMLDLTRVIAVRQESWQYPAATHYGIEDGLLTIRQSDEGKGKKHALNTAVRLVPTRYIWFNDDDAVLTPSDKATKDKLQGGGIGYVRKNLEEADPDMIILPLRMTNGSGKLLERLQALEYDAIQALTLRSAERGKSVMCAGANLIVKKESWLACEEALHPELPGGDDMFLLEAMKSNGMLVMSAAAPELFIAPCPTLRSLLRQRMRWAGKAPRFSDRDIRNCGIWTIISNVLAAVCPLWLIVKWIADTVLIGRRRKVTARDIACSLLLTIVYPYYMLICLIGGLLTQHPHRNQVW